MHVDLVEALRCPNAHEDGWLVASADVVEQRRIMHGVIGCPKCGAEWRVSDGALSFAQQDADANAGAPAAASSAKPPQRSMTAGPATQSGNPAPAHTPEMVMRLAAMLDLRDARGVVVLTGTHTHLADALVELAGVSVLAINPPDGVAMNHSRLLVSHQLPLGVGTVRGVVLDPAHADSMWMASAVRAVERGGRLVAPASVPVPQDVEALARDELQWVGEVRVAASGLVPLRRSGAMP